MNPESAESVNSDLLQQSHKILESLTALLSNLKKSTQAQEGEGIVLAVFSIFGSIDQILANLHFKPLEQFFQKINALSQFHHSTSGMLDKEDIEFLEKSQHLLDQIITDLQDDCFDFESQERLDTWVERCEQLYALEPTEKEVEDQEAQATSNASFSKRTVQAFRPRASEESFVPPLNPRFSLVEPSIDYFEQLSVKLRSKQVAKDTWGVGRNKGNKLISVTSDDGLYFDEAAIVEGLKLCQQLHEFLSEKISDDDFELLQSLFLFYRSPEQLLDHLKLLFTGDLYVKEKIIRIYGSKIVGSYNVVAIIDKNKDIFADYSKAEIKQFKADLFGFAEAPIQQIRSILPEAVQKRFRWTRSTLKKNICQVLQQPASMFQGEYDYNQVMTHFRLMIHCLLCDARVIHYFAWKNKYLRHWLFHELYDNDTLNIMAGETEKPQYTTVKVLCYQNLNNIFSTLATKDQKYDQSLQLSQEAIAHVSDGENYLQLDAYATTHPLEPIRQQEQTFLDSLSIVQIEALAESVHNGISSMRSAGQLQGAIPPIMNIRSIELAPSDKVEKVYQASILKMQWEHAKKLGKQFSNKFSRAFKALGKEHQTTAARPKEEQILEENALEIIPRQFGDGTPLKQAFPEWIGFGKDPRSNVYTPKIPNLQLTFFEHAGHRLHLYPSFQEFLQHAIQYYSELGYLQRVEREFKYGGTKKMHLDEAFYVNTEAGSVMAIGQTSFNRTMETTRYFQLFQTQPQAPIPHSTAKSYDRKINNASFFMESLESSSTVRPTLFRNLIIMIDSFPDSIRNLAIIQSLLQSLQEFLESDANPDATLDEDLLEME